MTDEEKKEIAEEAGKRLIWDLLDAKNELSNMSSYARHIIRKQDSCKLYKIGPSKELLVKYGLSMDGGYKNFVWWLLEQVEKGNIKIEGSNAQSES